MKMTISVGKSELAEEKEKSPFFPGIFLVIVIILKQLKL